MKEVLAIALGLMTSGLAAPEGWKLVWSDEFEVDGLPDSKKWGYEEGYVRNNELQYYTAKRSENARVEKGNLVIEARKDEMALSSKAKRTQGKKTAPITSASVTTEGTATWTYGRFEIRAKLPVGSGTWPAIWMLGTNMKEVGWPTCGELDIMEFVGNQPDTIHANVHTRDFNHTKNTGRGGKIKVEHVTKGFHTYAMEWSKDEIRFFFDDKPYFHLKNDGSGVGSWPFDKPQYLILNLAFGGSWGAAKGVDESVLPATYLIDYVRVYERK
ncbi:glycoside hydrolase family 16 protein [Haloferula sp.]|uniref:glycoside hydrolase family 16 protein n=1 Tax=Haloferula sp. TaxID=2497595 RepID=UPI00329B2208